MPELGLYKLKLRYVRKVCGKIPCMILLKPVSVCMYVSEYECMYICMYVCTQGLRETPLNVLAETCVCMYVYE